MWNPMGFILNTIHQYVIHQFLIKKTIYLIAFCFCAISWWVKAYRFFTSYFYLLPVIITDWQLLTIDYLILCYYNLCLLCCIFKWNHLVLSCIRKTMQYQQFSLIIFLKNQKIRKLKNWELFLAFPGTWNMIDVGGNLKFWSFQHSNWEFLSKH